MTAVHLQPCGSRLRRASRDRATDLIGDAIRRIRFTFCLWRERIRGRADLARLDERALRDIGLNPADRDFLVNKPFWRE